MRHKRAKSYRKAMHFYQQRYGFREPYQVLVTSDFIQEAVLKKISLVDKLQETLQGQTKPLITHCSITELLQMTPGQDKTQAIGISKTFEKRRCPHQTPIPGHQCLREIMGDTNQNHYCVAAQNEELRKHLRYRVVGTPLLYVKQHVIVLEKTAHRVSLEITKKMEKPVSGVSEVEQEMLRQLKREERKKLPPRKYRKKVPKGPNPLSVKKSIKKKR